MLPFAAPSVSHTTVRAARLLLTPSCSRNSISRTSAFVSTTPVRAMSAQRERLTVAPAAMPLRLNATNVLVFQGIDAGARFSTGGLAQAVVAAASQTAASKRTPRSPTNGNRSARAPRSRFMAFLPRCSNAQKSRLRNMKELCGNNSAVGKRYFARLLTES